MKFLAWVCGILLVLVVALYCVLFSSFGNSVLKPFVEKIASEKIGMERIHFLLMCKFSPWIFADSRS